jgi:hypothetical protein
MGLPIFYVARDEDGELTFFTAKPTKRAGYFYSDKGIEIGIDEELFPEVTFRNSPIEVSIYINNKLNNYYETKD